MKKLYALFAAMFFTALSYGQVYLLEDFGSGQMPPAGWTLDGQPNQWSCPATSKAGGIAPEAMFTYVNTVSTSRLVSPVIDMTGVDSEVSLTFNHFYDWYANGPKIGVATRFGTGEWTTVWERIPIGNVGPETVVVPLTNIGQPDFQFCIYITGNLYNLDYWYIDDIKLYIPLDLDAKLISVDLPSYIEADQETVLKGKIGNDGSSPITSFDVSYAIEGGNSFVYSVSGLDLELGETYNFTHNIPFMLSDPGSYAVVTTIENVNSGTDENMDNNTIVRSIGVGPFIPPKKVYGEEATGTWCGWCVRGICFMDYMAETYPDTWIGVAVHNGDPMVNAAYDDAIPTIIPNFPGYPSGTVDRTGGNFYDPSEFEAGYLERIDAISPGTIDIVNFSWDPDSRLVSLDLQSEFVVDVDHELRFAFVISEDSLYGTASGWAQANYYAGGGNGAMCGFESLPNPIPAAQMVYDHVAREILGTPYGTVNSIAAPILAGSTHNYTYTYTVPAGWKYDNLHFIGLLIDMGTGEILNANNVISDYVGIKDNFDEAQVSVYPNPAKNLFNIKYTLKETEEVKLAVYNSLGQLTYSEAPSFVRSGENNIQINSEQFKTGFYYIKLSIGNKSYTKKISVVK